VESNQPTSPSPPDVATPRSHKNLLIIVIAVVALTVVVGAFLATALLSTPTGQGAWLFKGAYANYEGSTSVMGYDFDFSVRLEVVDFNSTHAYLLAYSRIGSSVSEAVENQDYTWVELSSFGFANAFGESNMTNSYEANVNVEGLGTRNCMVYEYATDGPTITVYVDKALQWPVKMAVSMSGEDFTFPLSMDIVLADTNIPGLR
jgi:hypothetical protein